MIDLNDMTLFVHVARARSFTRAADELGISKSTLSRRISALEDRLSVRLLQRTTREVQPTELGVRYLEGAEAVVSQAEAVEHELSEMSEEPWGLLRLTATPSFSDVYLMPIIVEYLARYPRMSIDLDQSYRVVDLIPEGWDLAFRLGFVHDGDLVARRLGLGHRVWCASETYLRQRGTPNTPHDLSGHDCIAPGVTGRRALWEFGGPDGDLQLAVRGRLSVPSVEAALQAAKSHLGIAQLPPVVCNEAVAKGELVRVLAGWESRRDGVHAVYPSRRHLSPKVRTFLDLTLERCKAQVPWQADLVEPPDRHDP